MISEGLGEDAHPTPHPLSNTMQLVLVIRGQLVSLLSQVASCCLGRDSLPALGGADGELTVKKGEGLGP